MKIYSIDLEFFKNDPTYYFEKERFGKSFFYNVSYKGYDAKVYVFELYKILSNESFPLFKKNETLNGLSLIPIYIEGFKKGKEFFKNNYKVSTEILFLNINEYVKTLQTCYCHKEQRQGKRGWCWYKWNYPIIFNDEKIKEYGYFAGIISEIDELKENYTQFKVIGQCEHHLPPQQTETKTEQETENDFTLSTIEDWLFEFKEKMNEADYKNLVSALKQYFETGIFPTLSKPIQINGKPNKKLFGWALNRIFDAKGKGIEKELLQFAKQNISLFTDVKFDETNILKSNLYKYFTTKTK